MTDQANGWAQAPIGSLCILHNGRAFKPSEWQMHGIPIVRIQNLNNASAPYNHFLGEYDDRYHLRGGELLFAWSGTPGTSFGAHVWRGGEAVLNQHIFRVDFDEGMLDKRYFRYAINQKLNELIGIAHGGVGLRHVTKGKFEQTHVAVPPLGEQKRIADKLDAVLARVDACRERLDRVPDILKRFRQAVLAAATCGNLTEDWRAKSGSEFEVCHFEASAPPEGASVLPINWRWIAVGHLATKVVDGVHKKPQYVASGVPFLTVRNLTAGPGLDFSESSFVTNSDHDDFCRRTFPERDDILVSKDGTLGVVRLVDTDRPFSIFVSVALIKLRDRRMARYVQFALESPVVQAQMVGVGSGLQHIHLRDLRQDVVPLPPLDEQEVIVRRVETLFACADRLEARYATARAQVERLTPALLAKAFRGELVPQDPNDEPASMLLERIRAARASAPAKSRRGRDSPAAPKAPTPAPT